jgi:hypothetical protein
MMVSKSKPGPPLANDGCVTGQDTPLVPAGAMVLERKAKADGTIREYRCELVGRLRGVVVIRYRIPAEARGGAVFHPPIPLSGARWSDGYYWTRRPYNLYRFLDVGGQPVGHRLDAVAAVRVEDGAIAYRDLILDWWVRADGTIIEEDRDEFEAAVASGALSERDARAAEEAARQVLSRYRHIIDEAAAIERRLRRARG